MKILVVDDEQVQVESIARGLNLFGYSAATAGSVPEALELLDAAAPGEFDLVLTDLTMPELSGFALINRLRERWPDLPVIVITGLNPTFEIDEVRQEGVPVLQKPFSPDQLDQAIRDLLGAAEQDVDSAG